MQPLDVPVPLSFPAILRNPGISSLFVRLHDPNDVESDRFHLPSAVKKDGKEGKRWIRRRNNARFLGNPHVVPASSIDHTLPRPSIKQTFPEPLPSYLSRNTKIPPIDLPSCDPVTANAGRFSLSLKGMRRTLRRYGLRAQSLVRDVECEITSWLQEGGTLISPDATDVHALKFPGTFIGDTECIREVSRTPLQLVWSIGDDAFARYVVHCCARYHEIVSFSKDTSGTRLTYLLRPNTHRPDFRAQANIDTPPVTDLEHSSSHIDSESDVPSSEPAESDTERVPPTHLSVISEDPASSPSPAQKVSPRLSPSNINSLDDDGSWSVIEDVNADGYETGSDGGLAGSMASLSLDPSDPDMSKSAEPRPVRQHIRVWDHKHARSASSPSRSPARRPRPRRRIGVRIDPPRSIRHTRKSFYEYLYF